MNKRPDLTNLLPLFESSTSFSLTEEQYELKTGANLPQNTKYIEERSALAKFAEIQGYKITVQHRTVLCEKKS